MLMVRGDGQRAEVAVIIRPRTSPRGIPIELCPLGRLEVDGT